MNNKDLMIGDWVNVFGNPKQMEGIREFRNGDEVVYYDGDNGNFIENLTPIPLTSEILEKNGWKSYSHEDTPIFGMIQGFEIVLAWMDYYWQLCVDGTVYRKIKIRYVHELQHVLSLCEIEKEIIL